MKTDANLSSQLTVGSKKLAPLKVTKDCIKMVKENKTKKLLTNVTIDPKQSENTFKSPRPAAGSVISSDLDLTSRNLNETKAGLNKTSIFARSRSVFG